MKRFAQWGSLAAALAMAASTPALAVEGGVGAWLKGSGGFMAGVLPPAPGLYTTGIYYYYQGSAGAEVRGGNVELGVDTTIDAALLEGLYVSDWHSWARPTRPEAGSIIFGRTSMRRSRRHWAAVRRHWAPRESVTRS